MRLRLVWLAAVLGSVTLFAALVAATATSTPDREPTLITSPSWRAVTDIAGPVDRGPSADEAWLALGSVPGEGTRWGEMVRIALLDLRQLSGPGGAVAAGAGSSWNYDWPRDTAFVAVALARAGHHGEALETLGFLQRVQLPDGGFEARYLLDGSGTPDGRARQSDGAGWVLWALDEVGRASGVGVAGTLVGPPASARELLDDATEFALAETNDGRRLPPPSPDYWEVGVRRTSLGTVAPLLAGLRASQQMYAALDESALSRRSGAAAARLATIVDARFADGYERFGSRRFRDGGGRDAAVTFLMPPFADSATPRLVDAWLLYQSDALRPAGGLAPGERWKQDGISWTPETAMVAYTAAMSGHRELAETWMDWLSAHRTAWGSLPEKVLANGAPAGPAPLAWTSALVILTAAELDPTSAHR